MCASGGAASCTAAAPVEDWRRCAASQGRRRRRTGAGGHGGSPQRESLTAAEWTELGLGEPESTHDMPLARRWGAELIS